MTTIDLIEFKLHGIRALVTGSASGIGLATATRLARSGARVAMNDLPTDALTRAVGDLRARGFSVDAVPGDLSNSATAREVGLKSLELLGGLDYLVNNAGAPGTRTPIPPADLEALTDDFWDRILRINLLSAFWMTKTLARALTHAQRRGGEHGLGVGIRRRREQHRLCDRQGGARGIDAGTGPWTRSARAGQWDCAGLREFQLGMLVR